MTPARTALLYAMVMAMIGAIWLTLGGPRNVPAPAIATNKKLQCVSYAPFREGQSPYAFDTGLRIPREHLEADLRLLAQRFECVRTYSVRGLEAVPELAAQLGLKVLLGAWVSADPIATQKELWGAIALARRHTSVVRAVVVGNETLLRKEVTGRQLADYIRQVKRALPDVPVTYADVWEFWLQHPEVAPATDFITIHILPYWEDKPTAIAEALAHVRTVRQTVASKMPGKEILIGEIGWPSAGRMREGALPSIRNQAFFVRGFVELAEREHWQYNLIEAFDQPWKRANEGTVGGAWGLYDTHRHDKGVLAGPVYPHPRAWLFGLISAALALATWPLLARSRVLGGFRLLILASAITTGAVLLGLQLEQFTEAADTPLAWAYAGILLLLGVACYGLTVSALAGGRRDSPAPLARVFGAVAFTSLTRRAWISSFVFAALLLCMVGETVGLVFDARYRDFNNFIFALPSFAYLTVFTERPDERNPPQAVEKALAWGLVAAAGFICYQETPRNLQANAWVLLCLMMATALWRNFKFSRAPHLTGVLLGAASAYTAAAAVRFLLMEAPKFVERCTEGGDALCALRSALGLMIHFRVFGWLGLVCTVAALASGSGPLRTAAVILATFGLVLYNADLGIVALTLVIVAVARAVDAENRCA